MQITSEASCSQGGRAQGVAYMHISINEHILTHKHTMCFNKIEKVKVVRDLYDEMV